MSLNTNERLENPREILDILFLISERNISLLVWQKKNKKSFKAKLLTIYENLGLEISYLHEDLDSFNENEEIYFYVEEMDLIFKTKIFKRKIASIVASIPQLILNLKARKKKTMLRLIKTDEIILPSSSFKEEKKIEALLNQENRRDFVRNSTKDKDIRFKIRKKIKARNIYKEDREIPLKDIKSFKVLDISRSGVSFLIDPIIDYSFRKNDIIQVFTQNKNSNENIKINGKVIYCSEGRMGIKFLSLSKNISSFLFFTN